MKKKMRSTLYLVALIVLTVYFFCIIIDQQKILDSKNKIKEQLQEEIKKEELLNEELKKRLEIINTDEYIEKIAREKLGMVKPGEKIFVDVNK